MAKLTCLVCLKKYLKPEDDNLYSPYQRRLLSSPTSSVPEDNLYTRFLHLCTRHLKLNLVALPLINGRRDNSAFCPKCNCLVSYLCDLYHELEVVKLHLHWKLKELGKEIKYGLDSKQSHASQKALSEQLNVSTIRGVKYFRTAMKQKATRKNGFTPKLVIAHGLLPEMWKFSYSETRSTLARLIFLFALASKKLCSKPEVKAVFKEEADGNYHPEGSDYGGDFDGLQSDKADSDWSNPSPSQSDEDYKPLKKLASKKNLRKRKLLGSETGPLPKKRRRTRKRKNNHDPNDKFQAGSLKKHGVRRRLRPLPARYQHHIPNSTCKICNEDLETLIKLEEHMVSVHESLHETSHQCWFCPKRFSLPETLLVHRWNEHGMFKCDETNCKQAFPSVDEHEQHLQSHLEDSPTGNDSASNKEEPSQAIHHCSKCNMGFLHSALLGYHELVHLERVPPPNMGGEGEFPCPKCNKYYKNKTHLSSHYRENHLDSELAKKTPFQINKGSNLWTCDNGNCTFSTTSIYFLQQHIRQMHPDANSCQVCGLVFPTNRAKLAHLKEEHKIQSKEYPCPHCDANFVVSSSLQNHIRNVHCERLHVCDICGKACKKATHLVEHKEYHHNPNRTKHICSTCESES